MKKGSITLTWSEDNPPARCDVCRTTSDTVAIILKNELLSKIYACLCGDCANVLKEMIDANVLDTREVISRY